MLHTIKVPDAEGKTLEVDLLDGKQLHDLYGVTQISRVSSFTDVHEWAVKREAKLKQWLDNVKKLDLLALSEMICSMSEEAFNDLYESKKESDPDWAKALLKIRKIGSIQ